VAHLTEKRRSFIEAYMSGQCANATVAAIAAGYPAKSATKIASKLLTCPAVKKELERRRGLLEERTLVTQEKVLREYARIAFANPGKFLPAVDGGITLEDLKALSEDDLAAISELTSYTLNDKTTWKIRLHGKLQALEALSKYLGLFEKDNRQKGASVDEFLQRLVRDVPRSTGLPHGEEEY
jgi:phage terminase small subunit